MEIIRSLFGSKKFATCFSFLVLMMLAAIVSHFFGVEFTEAQIYSAAGAVSAYFLSQGAADLGKEKARAEQASLAPNVTVTTDKP